MVLGRASQGSCISRSETTRGADELDQGSAFSRQPPLDRFGPARLALALTVFPIKMEREVSNSQDGYDD